MPLDMNQFRQGVEAFLSALDEAYYLQKAGLKDSLELGPIYERHASLMTLDSARELGERVAAGEPLVDLWRWTCEEYLESLVEGEREEVGRLESTLEAEVDGARIPYQMLYTQIGDEADRGRRQRLEDAQHEIIGEHLNGPLARVFEARRAAIATLGASSELALYERFGLDLANLAGAARALLADTQGLFEERFGAHAERRLGVQLDQLRRHDVTRLWRAPEWDGFLVADRMVPALEATLADLGIDLHAQSNVELDIEDRPAKRPRPFCAPIDVPDRIVLVTKPLGGVEDWRGLFHESGHAEQFAFIPREASIETKKLGDFAISEGFAFLMELLVDDPAWLRRHGLDAEGARDFVRDSAVMRLYLVRRYCGKLLYELELNGGGDLTTMPQRYHAHYRAAIGIDTSPTEYLLDVDPGFYGSAYLRAWAFEAQLAEHLTDRFGSAWFASREAGAYLRELWAQGQATSSSDFIEEITGKPLNLAAIGERIRSRLA